MAASLVQTSPSPFPPGEVLSPESGDLREYDRELRFAARDYRRSLARIAWFGSRLCATEGWRQLGYPDEDAYRESLDIPHSTWHKYLRLGYQFQSLSVAEFESIKVTNLQTLLSVSPTILQDYNWIQEAKTLKPERLADLVTQRNKTVGDDREPLVYLGLKIPLLAKRAIETMLDNFQRQHGLSSKGQALEMLVADKSDRQSLLASASKARKLLQGIVLGLQVKSNQCAVEQERQWAQLALEVLNEACSQAVSAARAESAGGEDGEREADMSPECGWPAREETPDGAAVGEAENLPTM